jgi:hypothetical protein
MVAAILDSVFTMIKLSAAVILALAVVASAANAQTPVITPPGPGVPANPVAPASAGPTPAPAQVTPPPALVQFTGQLLDVRDGFVYFTTGDAFPAVTALRVVDYFTGQVTAVAPTTKMFARATFDPVSKKIIELAITTKRLQASRSLGDVSAFVVVGSKPVPAPEIAGQNITGKMVAVEFEVTVPPTTSFTDQIYISTDSSDWNPTAIKLDRVDAYRYRAQRFFASGTKFAYRVTRGTWNSVERGEDNLDGPPHQFFVREVDSLVARVTVYHWSDEHGTNQGAGPDAIPTPYNSNPFGGGTGGIAVPQIPIRPTPLPGH